MCALNSSKAASLGINRVLQLEMPRDGSCSAIDFIDFGVAVADEAIPPRADVLMDMRCFWVLTSLRIYLMLGRRRVLGLVFVACRYLQGSL